MRSAGPAGAAGRWPLLACLGLWLGCGPAPALPPTPPATTAVQPPLEGRSLVLSDLHFDPFADPALVPELVATPATAWRAILERSSIRVPSDYRKDTSYRLLASALDAARAAVPAPDFVIVPGDFLRHGFDKVFVDATHDSRPEALEAFADKVIRFVALELSSRFPEAPIFPVLGNNDTPCTDYRIPTRSAFLRSVASAWAPLVNRQGGAPGFAETFAEGGYYTAKLPAGPRTRLLGLDSVLWSAHYREGCGKAPTTDPGKDEIAWLDAALTAIEKDGDGAWLVSHIPPGVDVYATLEGGDPCAPQPKPVAMMYGDAYQAPFLATVEKHASVVRLVLGGHTHMLDYRLYTSGGRPTVAHLFAPAVSPMFGNNPSFLVLRFDRATGAVKDAGARVLTNLPAARGGAAPEWEARFDFDAAYGKTEISPASLQAVHTAVGADPKARAAYVQGYNGGSALGGIAGEWHAYWCGNVGLSAGEFTRCQCGGSAARP